MTFKESILINMIAHGCPAHYEIWSEIAQANLHTTRVALYTLLKEGKIRRVRRGVYSAGGPERD